MSEIVAAYVQGSEMSELLAGNLPVVIDCTASWCGPCKLVSPIMDALAADYDGRAKVLKLDIDENKDIAKKYGIRSIPAVLMFKNGELINTIVGAQKSKQDYSVELDALL